ncbi:MAG: hypothetical protein R3305_03150, partial [Gammaproteobacteria bacterium]|nr:hypothetical protein [Gammaproteobacteria bacterium]
MTTPRPRLTTPRLLQTTPRLLPTTIASLGALFGATHAAAQPGGPPAPPCDPANYVCNQRAPEDLVAMGSDWAVASAFSGA